MSQKPKHYNHWRPSANFATLKQRANLLKKIRNFFENRKILEVETPLCDEYATTDPNLDPLSLKTRFSEKLYLQTSPEFAMKRLIAAGYGDIYQICKAFRDEQNSTYHRREFTIIEWYRMHFALEDLKKETLKLLHTCLGPKKVKEISYRDVLKKYTGCDYNQDKKDLLQVIDYHGICLGYETQQKLNKEECLDVIFSHIIQPKFQDDQIWIIQDFPASQVALAELTGDGNAKRFEIFIEGVELANAYQELIDADILEKRFYCDLKVRQDLGKPTIPIDKKLLAAQKEGDMPKCSGIALGFDRLCMLVCQKFHIQEVCAF